MSFERSTTRSGFNPFLVQNPSLLFELSEALQDLGLKFDHESLLGLQKPSHEQANQKSLIRLEEETTSRALNTSKARENDGPKPADEFIGLPRHQRGSDSASSTVKAVHGRPFILYIRPFTLAMLVDWIGSE